MNQPEKFPQHLEPEGNNPYGWWMTFGFIIVAAALLAPGEIPSPINNVLIAKVIATAIGSGLTMYSGLKLLRLL